MIPHQSSQIDQEKIVIVKEQIASFKWKFSHLMVDVQMSLSVAEKKDNTFLAKFCMHVLALPVSKKPMHKSFFRESEDEILGAKSSKKIVAILNRYCDYSNYEIIFCIVREYCDDHLKENILEYQETFTKFEIDTTIEIYVQAISVRPGSEICKEFTRMAMKINKLPSECNLHEIRQLKESIAEEASIHSYSVYIERKQEGSVRVVLRIQPEAVGLIAAAMTTEFQNKHNLSNVTIEGKEIQAYVVRVLTMCMGRFKSLCGYSARITMFTAPHCRIILS